MRTMHEAIAYSKKHPDVLVEFKDLYPDSTNNLSGSILNNELEGEIKYYYHGVIEYKDVYDARSAKSEHTIYRRDGSISDQFFCKTSSQHGEFISFDTNGVVTTHMFKVNSYYIKELDYLLDEDRDEAFYVTLALHGIDKEYTF